MGTAIATPGRHVSNEEADAYQNGMHIEEIPEKYIPKGDSGLDVEVLRASLLLRELQPSERVNRARLNGEKWAINVTRENLARLPERQLVAFLWFYWGKRKHREIAERMDISIRTVENLIAFAKKQLAGMNNATNQ